MRPSGTEGLTPCLLLKGVFVQLRIREKKTTTTTTTKRIIRQQCWKPKKKEKKRNVYK